MEQQRRERAILATKIHYTRATTGKNTWNGKPDTFQGAVSYLPRRNVTSVMTGNYLLRNIDIHIRACQSPEPVARTLPAGLRSIEITMGTVSR